MLTREKAVERLTKRFREQAFESPLFRRHISLDKYVSANVGHVMRNELLARYDPEHRSWCRYGFECHK